MGCIFRGCGQTCVTSMPQAILCSLSQTRHGWDLESTSVARRPTLPSDAAWRRKRATLPVQRHQTALTSVSSGNRPGNMDMWMLPRSLLPHASVLTAIQRSFKSLRVSRAAAAASLQPMPDLLVQMVTVKQRAVADAGDWPWLHAVITGQLGCVCLLLCACSLDVGLTACKDSVMLYIA